MKDPYEQAIEHARGLAMALVDKSRDVRLLSRDPFSVHNMRLTNVLAEACMVLDVMEEEMNVFYAQEEQNIFCHEPQEERDVPESNVVVLGSFQSSSWEK